MKTTINTTTLPQTIISSLDPVTVRAFEQETRALETFAFANARVSCSNTRTLTGSSDDIIVCGSVIVLMVVFVGGIETNAVLHVWGSKKME